MIHKDEIESALNDGRPILTAKQFLGKAEGTKYFEPEGLMKYVRSLRPKEVYHTKEVFSSMQSGYRVVGSLAGQPDKGKRWYVFVNFHRGNATTGAKLILEGGMTQFLQDYADFKFVVGFTLEELIEEALAE